jgi:MoxR-like ATPase
MADTLVGQIEALGDALGAARASVNRRFIGQDRGGSGAGVDAVRRSCAAGRSAGSGQDAAGGYAVHRHGPAGSRIQFTPDLMPADILGSEVLETGADGTRAFRFIEGPIFCQLLMADEINRASPARSRRCCRPCRKKR